MLVAGLAQSGESDAVVSGQRLSDMADHATFAEVVASLPEASKVDGTPVDAFVWSRGGP